MRVWSRSRVSHSLDQYSPCLFGNGFKVAVQHGQHLCLRLYACSKKKGNFPRVSATAATQQSPMRSLPAKHMSGISPNSLSSILQESLRPLDRAAPLCVLFFFFLSPASLPTYCTSTRSITRINATSQLLALGRKGRGRDGRRHTTRHASPPHRSRESRKQLSGDRAAKGRRLSAIKVKCFFLFSPKIYFVLLPKEQGSAMIS